ncbi:hypothetical protein FGG77_24580, partial [Escherichia coli]
DAWESGASRGMGTPRWTRQKMEGHASRKRDAVTVAVEEMDQRKAELLARTLQSALEERASVIHSGQADKAYRISLRIDGGLHP